MSFEDKNAGKDPNPKEVERTKKRFGHCFEVTQIDDGDPLPVGGDSIYSQEANIGVICDLESFNDFLDESQELASRYDMPELKKWLESQGFEIEEDLFAALYAFTSTFEEHYSGSTNNPQKRRELYRDKTRETKLSDVFEAEAAECAEIAALAQAHLQRAQVPSTFFSGDVLWKKEHEFSTEHSFIVIRYGEKVYIYDPANPLSTNAGKFPSVYTTEADFDKEMNEHKKRFVTAKNVLSKKEAYFGVNNGTNVTVERDII